MSCARPFFVAVFALALFAGALTVSSARAQSLSDTRPGSHLVTGEQGTVVWDGKGLRPSI